MIKFDKKYLFLFSIICFLFMFNFALLLKIPYILPLFGLIILCVVPGYLLCLLFKIKVIDIYENLLHAIGISIIFDIFFGLIINTVLPVLGVNNPLFYLNLQILFSIIILIFAILIIYSDNIPSISYKMLKISKIEKIFLIFGFLILICILFGIYLVNTNVTNAFLIFSILLIPILLILLIVCHDEFIKRIYPVIIYLFSFSLLMLLSLRSNYLIGIDSHEEYYFFITTLVNSVWIPESFLLSATLSISILPTIFENFLNINPQILFKLLFPVLFSITPLIIFVIAKKYFNELLALIASCFFMFQLNFVTTSANSRTSLGIFFFAFVVLLLCNKELSNVKKYALVLIFIAGIVFSHYSAAYIFVFIISLAYGMNLVINKIEKRKEIQFINMTLIIYSISLIFFWYQEINKEPFRSLLTINKPNLLKNDSINYIHYTPTIYPSLLLQFVNYTRLSIYVLIGLGVFIGFFNMIQKEIKGYSFPKFSANVDRFFIFMGIITFSILVGINFLPDIFLYDTSRLQGLIFVILSVFLILGACFFFKLVLCEEISLFSKTKLHKKIEPLIKYCRSNQYKLISLLLLFLLIPQLLFATSIINQFNQGPYSLILNSPKYSRNIDQMGYVYSFDQDAIALKWFKEHSFGNESIFSDDYGNQKITSMINQKSSLYQRSITEKKDENVLNGYIFLTVMNENYASFYDSNGEIMGISSLNPILNQKNKIFNNEAVLYK